MIDQYSGAFAKSLDKSDPLGKYREKHLKTRFLEDNVTNNVEP